MFRLASAATAAASVVRSRNLVQQCRGYKDGRKALMFSWRGFWAPESHGGPRYRSQWWKRYARAPPRRPQTYYPIPLSMRKERPHHDPYTFKYVGCQVGPDGRPAQGMQQRHREQAVRQEFKALLSERNWHGFPNLFPTKPSHYMLQWQGSRRVKGLYY
eukprot:Hpha_TRINITY_DN4052_c0_g1::TRINITY_DN4052_c0_g1_i1::g.63685::m.63685